MTQDTAKEQAQAQYDSISRMVDALDVDYDRLAELVETNDDDLTDDERDELETLRADAGDCTDQDEAREQIREDALSVEVRSDWGRPGETMSAVEFRILLCTGGPAVQIRGELDEHGEPVRAWLEYQDWGTPWMHLFEASQAELLRYCAEFYFSV